MDNERIIKIVKRVDEYIIDEKKASFKSYLIKRVLENPDIINIFDITSLHIKESVIESPASAGEHLKRAMLYMDSHYIKEMVRLIGTYSKNGVEFLKYLQRNLEIDENQLEKLKEFTKKIETTNRLISEGFNETEATHLASSKNYIIKLDNSKTYIVSGISDVLDGVTDEAEELVYKELENPETKKRYFVLFIIKGRNYLRYIGKTNGKLVHVTNEKGTFEEIQNKSIRLKALNKKEETKAINQFKLNKQADIDAETLISVYDEIEELSSFNGNSLKAEEIFEKQIKIYKLK